MKDYLKILNHFFTITISGNSMYPVFYDGEKVKFKKVYNEDEISEGTIIIFYNKKIESYISHRVIHKIEIFNDSIYYVTKGDNNLIVDEYLITFKDIRGVI